MGYNPSPTIVFKVSLTTQNQYSFLPPDQYNPSPDTGRTQTTNEASTRSTWMPGFLDGENLVHVHNDQVTLYGWRAQYYNGMISKGYFPELSVVSTTI